MNFDVANKWLTLLANIGVLVGIVFLFLEIDQSNRIAERETRSELLDFNIESNRASWENPEIAALMVKLRDVNPELNDIEGYRAFSYANLQVNHALRLNATHEDGFLSDELLVRNLNGNKTFIQGIPGLAPYLRQAIERVGLTELAFGEDGPRPLRNLAETILIIESNAK